MAEEEGGEDPEEEGEVVVAGEDLVEAEVEEAGAGALVIEEAGVVAGEALVVTEEDLVEAQVATVEEDQEAMVVEAEEEGLEVVVAMEGEVVMVEVVADPWEEGLVEAMVATDSSHISVRLMKQLLCCCVIV